ncbi:MAG: MFS transporter [Oscillospiraceae bacterium]|nr:MFS transporter [Oscillospiraceae bacterium]
MNNTEGTGQMSLWSRHYVKILLANCFVATCMFFHNAVTTLYVVSIGGTASYAGVMLTCFTVVATIMRIVSGRMLDQRGRRKIILIGLAIYAVATASLTIRFLPYLPVARAIQAIGYSMATTGLSVAVTDVVPVPQMGEGLGYNMLANNVASALGPVIALWIYGITESYAIVYYVSVGLIAVSFVIMLICRYETDREFFARKQSYELAVLGERARMITQDTEERKASFFATIFEKKAIPSTIAAVFIFLGNGAVIAYIVLFAQTIDIKNTSLFFMLQALMTIVSRLLFSKLSDKRPTMVSIIPGTVILALGYYFLMEAPHNHLLFHLAGAALGLGAGICTPALNAEAVRYVPQSRRGAASATFFMATDIGIGIGGVLWGAFVDRGGFRTVFLGCVICIAVSLLLCFLFFSGKGKEAGRTE